MAKTPKNAEKFPIRWDGTIDSPFLGADNNEVPDSESIIWGNNEYTWGDVQFVQEVVDGLATGNRRAREARLQQFDNKKKKKLIHLICRVKGEKVYDEKKEVSDVNMNIKLEDVDLVINEVLGKIKVEKTNVL